MALVWFRLSRVAAAVLGLGAAEVRRRDNWRKELADAGAFAPRLAANRLIDERAFKAALCSGRIKWVVADRSERRVILTWPLRT